VTVQSAAEGVADHADERGRSVQRRQPVRGRRVDDLPPPRSRSDPGRASARVDVHRRHPAGRDEHRPVGGHDGLVAGGQHGHRQSVRGREAHGGLNVPRARGADDHRRVMGERQVVGGALGGV
jgi:hypothetical protein